MVNGYNEVAKINQAKSGPAFPQPSSPRSAEKDGAAELDAEETQKICRALRATHLGDASARPSALITRTPSPNEAPIVMKKPTIPLQKVTERKRKRCNFSSEAPSSHEGESPQKKPCRKKASRTSSADTAVSASSSDHPRKAPLSKPLISPGAS